MNTPFVPAGRTTVSHLVDSPIGPLALTSDGTALTGVYMLDPGQPGPDLPRDPAPFQAVTAELAAYFAGELETFTVPLAPTGSAFQLAVWAELTRIPYGVTSTYGGIAKALGKRPVASRAVGSANGANPIPIIVPCHRVIGADGGLTGYGGGLPRKLALLKIEGAAGLWLSVAGMVIVANCDPRDWNVIGVRMRPIRMNRKYVAILGVAVAACAGCGEQAASAAGGAAPPSASLAASDPAACADIGQATKVVTLRHAALVDPSRVADLQRTNTDPTQVQALFSDLCAVVAHPAPSGGYGCPADFGISYSGAFYAGTRELATFLYGITGCQTVTLTSGSQTRSSLVAGPAAQAAPRLESDFAIVVGIPLHRLYSPSTPPSTRP